MLSYGCTCACDLSHAYQDVFSNKISTVLPRSWRVCGVCYVGIVHSVTFAAATHAQCVLIGTPPHFNCAVRASLASLFSENAHFTHTRSHSPHDQRHSILYLCTYFCVKKKMNKKVHYTLFTHTPHPSAASTWPYQSVCGLRIGAKKSWLFWSSSVTYRTENSVI